MKLYDVARAGEVQFTAEHAHAAHGENVVALFGQRFIVAADVVELPLCGAGIFLPLLLDVDERHWRRQNAKCWMPDIKSPSSRASI